MTTNRNEAIEQALQGLGNLPNGNYCYCPPHRHKTLYGHTGACERANKALAMPKDAEPAGYTSQQSIDDIANGECSGALFGTFSKGRERTVPLYAHPPKADTERVALLERIDETCSKPSEMHSEHEKALYLLADIRAYLGGDK
jgi:hypothetical protein